MAYHEDARRLVLGGNQEDEQILVRDCVWTMETTATRLIGMDDMRILVANEPRAYRDVIAAAFRELRPQHEVIPVEPDQLDGEVARLHPHLVICSRLSEMVETGPLTWVMLYPDNETRTVISIAGEQTVAADVEFSELLSVIDQTELIAQLS